MAARSWLVKLVKAVIVLAALAPLSGCPREWHFTITGFGDAGIPQFCVSTRSNCSGSGVGLSHFDVDELPPPILEQKYRRVWGIMATSNAPLREFRYGVTPIGWKQTYAPEPLHLNTIYRVDDHWFRLTDRGGKPAFEVGSMSELIQ
jgi:hypothetical protein